MLTDFDANIATNLNCCFMTDEKVVVVMEYCQGGDLFSLCGCLTEDKVRDYSAVILLEIEKLHSLKVLHRDIKSENILIDNNGVPKLADFGYCKYFESTKRRAFTVCGTQEINAPEMTGSQSSGYSFYIDWWSFGCLLYELICGHSPFYSTDRRILQKNILFKSPFYPAYMTKTACNLISQLLEKDLSVRLIDPEIIKRHPFFASVDWVKVEHEVGRANQPKINVQLIESHLPLLESKFEPSRFCMSDEERAEFDKEI